MVLDMEDMEGGHQPWFPQGIDTKRCGCCLGPYRLGLDWGQIRTGLGLDWAVAALEEDQGAGAVEDIMACPLHQSQQQCGRDSWFQ